MKKIIFITREGINQAGARVRCYDFARQLSKLGLRAEVFSFADHLGAKDGKIESQLKISDKVGLNFRALIKILSDRNSFFVLQRVNYHVFAPYIARLFNNSRLIFDMDDWEMRENIKYHFGFYPSSKAYLLTKHIARRSIFCIAASKYLEGFLKNINNKTYYIPTAVDLQNFKPRAANNEEKKDVTLSWIGTFNRPEYIANIEYVLRCFKRLRTKYNNVYLDIVGDGIYGQDIHKMINRMNDSNISLRHWIWPNSMSVYLDNIDIGLLPIASLNKFNSAKSPTKLFEYMAMAKPTVASSIGEATHILTDQVNGLLANSQEEFTEKLEMLICQPQLRLDIGCNARKTVREYYSLDIAGIQLYNIFSKHI